MTKETPERRHGAAHAAHTKPFVAAAGDKGTEIGRLERGEAALVQRTADMFLRKIKEPRHVVAIGTQRMRAHTALMGERRDPFLFQSLGRSSHARTARSSARAK